MDALNDAGLIDTTGKSLWELVEARAAATPDKQMARNEAGGTLTYGAYREACLRAAAGLRDLGVGAGTPVSWILPSRFEALVLAGALAYLGAVQNPILPIYRQREIGFITRQSGCQVLIVPGVFRGTDFAAVAAEATADLPVRIVVADPALPEGDPATLPGPAAPRREDGSWPVRWLFYSSGTTADPKGAQHTDATISAANDSMQWSMQIGPDDRTAVVFPITHVGGLVWLFNTMQTGVELLLVEVFSATESPRWLGANGVTLAGAGTAFFLAYLAVQRSLPAGEKLFPDVRMFNGGGAPKPDTLHGELMEAFGAPYIGGYGLTEAPIIVMMPLGDPDDKKATTEGKPAPGVELKLVTLDGRVAARGEEGEIRTKCRQLFVGYLDSSLDADAFDEDGWFRTGDLGIWEPGGWVRITGRVKDIIIRKGENIAAKEIEDILFTHPSVADVAVVGLPDAERGEMACAVVVTAAGAEPLTFPVMQQYLRDHQLSAHKIPERLEVVDVLPRNPSGKVLKRDLRTMFSPAGS